jgi:hypothetical protein
MDKVIGNGRSCVRDVNNNVVGSESVKARIFKAFRLRDVRGSEAEACAVRHRIPGIYDKVDDDFFKSLNASPYGP